MKRFKILFTILDIIFAMVSYWMAAMLRYDGALPAALVGELWVTIPLIASALLLFSLVMGCNEGLLSYAGFSEMIRQMLSVLGVTFVLFAAKVLGLVTTPNSMIVINGILLFALTGGVRLFDRFYNWMSAFWGHNKTHTKRVLVIGAGEGGAMIMKRWRANKKDHKYPVAVIDDDPEKQGKRICGIKICGTSADIERVAKESKAEAILIAIPSAGVKTIKNLYHLSLPTGLPVKFFQSVVSMQHLWKAGSQQLLEVPVEELLSRESEQMDVTSSRQLIQGKTVLVTGGAGSIGSELCRQILDMDCKTLIIFDINENAMFKLNEELKRKYSAKRYQLVIGSVRDVKRLEYVFEQWMPQLVFHAAAHKHVPMMEANPIEAIQNNFIGTRNVIRASKQHKVAKFVLISTDKAVNPTNTMGATKRLCEMLLQSEPNSKTTLAAVRFGNVIGSNGSVVPLFKSQIAEGGPVTVTDPEITRYFMTIQEAVSLVLTAATMAKDREIFVLDMGKPIKIYELACNLIRSSGLEPNQDIDIVFTGLRPGEKLYEELYLDSENLEITQNEKIMCLKPGKINEIKLRRDIEHVESAIQDQTNEKRAYDSLFEAISNDETAYPDAERKEVLVH